eukprot:gene10220-11906_t
MTVSDQCPGVLGNTLQGRSLTIQATGATSPSFDCAGVPFVQIGSAVKVTLTNLIISSQATCVAVTSSPLYVKDSSFVDCAYGAIQATTAAVSISGTQFQNCNSDNHGGAIFNAYGSTIVQDSLFANNKAANNGGAIYSWSVTIVNSIFNDNVAAAGGAIWADKAKISGSTFQSNGANVNGGAAYILSTISSSNTRFISNQAQEGGAIYANDAFEAIDSTFNDNSAVNGGAIYQADGPSAVEFNLLGSSFSGNTAHESAGAIYLSNAKKTKSLIGGRFSGSTSTEILSQFKSFTSTFQPYHVLVKTAAACPANKPAVIESHSYWMCLYVTGQECTNGIANITADGVVANCICFAGYGGKLCTPTISGTASGSGSATPTIGNTGTGGWTTTGMVDGKTIGSSSGSGSGSNPAVTSTTTSTTTSWTGGSGTTISTGTGSGTTITTGSSTGTTTSGTGSTTATTSSGTTYQLPSRPLDLDPSQRLAVSTTFSTSGSGSISTTSAPQTTFSSTGGPQTTFSTSGSSGWDTTTFDTTSGIFTTGGWDSSSWGSSSSDNVDPVGWIAMCLSVAVAASSIIFYLWFVAPELR